jgi:hypothetical protein
MQINISIVLVLLDSHPASATAANGGQQRPRTACTNGAHGPGDGGAWCGALGPGRQRGWGAEPERKGQPELRQTSRKGFYGECPGDEKEEAGETVKW